MTVSLKYLYDEMQAALDQWTNVTRPIAKNWSPASLEGNPDYFERFSNFRKTEWDKYVAARDRYLRAVTERK